MIAVSHEGGVAVVKLDRGVTNALNLELVHALAAAVKEAGEEPQVRGLVLSSTGHRFFSIGFDLPELLPQSKEEFRAFYRAFNHLCLEVYTLPKPTVAALLGHAVAGGCILALCCDYRLMAAGRNLSGLNEIQLGVPVPCVAHRLLRELVGVHNARQVVDGGELYESEAARDIGLVDRVLAEDEVLRRAVDKAAELGSLPSAAFAAIKRDRVAGIAAELRAQSERDEEVFVELWYSQEARRRLQEATVKF